MGTPEQSDRSTDSERGDAKILLVDDEPELVETYAIMLETEYTVLTATNGSGALDRVDGTVDIVFLDRRMPDLSGDEVLAKLRQQGYDMPIAMLTAVDPAEDIVDMPFDDYITKPVERKKLFEKVDVLLNRSEFDDTSRELYSLASKKAALEASGIDDSNRDIYQRVCEDMDELRGRIDETLNDLFEDEPDAAFRNL